MPRKQQQRTTQTLLQELRLDLEARSAAVENIRTPGGLKPEGVYWNGFHSGIQVALGMLRRWEDSE